MQSSIRRALLVMGLLASFETAYAVEWPHVSIRAAIRNDDQYLQIGQFLQLDRELRADEHGWKQMRIDLPDMWAVEQVEVSKEGITLRIRGGRIFAVSSEHIGELSFRILDGGGKSDRQLEQIWSTYERKG